MYAAFAVLFLFVLQITFFAALASFDAKRVAAGRIDCCPCLPCCKQGCPCCKTVSLEAADEAIARGDRDPNQLCCPAAKHEGGRMGALLEGIVAPQLVKPMVGGPAMVAFFLFFVISIWQATQLAVRDSSRLFVPDDHYFMTTLQTNDQYFGNLGTSMYFMTEDGNYFESQVAMTSISEHLADLDYVQTDGDAFESWAESFKEYCQVSCTVTHENGIVTAESDYYSALSGWLQGPGRRYTNDVKWVDDDPQNGIRASRIMAEFTNFMGEDEAMDTEAAVNAMDGARDAAASWTGMPNVVVYSREFLTWETFRIIKKEMMMSVGLCLLAVLVITFGLIAHPTTSLLVFLCVVMTIVDVLGCMNMWGLAIDSVSVIQLVISVGLCVDYAAHVGHAFMKTPGTSRGERVIKTLGNVGAAVLNGGFSTFLATMVLAFSKSYVFRVLFQTFFLTVVLGLAHGLILLPVMLSLIGPAPYDNSPPEDKTLPVVMAKPVDEVVMAKPVDGTAVAVPVKMGNAEAPPSEENKAAGA
jgi:predicted RND superfamily exporter protein